MSLDNANPTVFRKPVAGGGRKRYNFQDSPQSDDGGFDLDLNHKVDYDKIFNPSKYRKYGFFSESDADKTSKKERVHTVEDYIDAQEIYGLISTISDPEHPLTLGSLAVVNLEDIHLTPERIDPTRKAIARVVVEITPTVTHCSLATVIGLGIRVRLEQALPPNIRVEVKIKAGTHSSADQNNKQLADKERVAAALENKTLMTLINRMMETCE